MAKLLIIIMIMAILAGMMMLASGAAKNRAEYTQLIRDIRSLKSAVIMFRMDNAANIEQGLPIGINGVLRRKDI